MKNLLVCFLLGCTTIFGATAPDSIAGKVYRDTYSLGPTNTFYQKTIIFGSDGRYIYLKFANPVVSFTPFPHYLQTPQSDGTYVYDRTADPLTRVTMLGDDGTKDGLLMIFTSATEGATGNGNGDKFFLSDAALIQTAPALNVSMRGHLDSGHPLMAGFVVPGASAPSAPQNLPFPGFPRREVLIRVVGPSLAQFGVAGTWADPDFQLFRGIVPAQVFEVHYADWSVAPPVSSGSIFPGTLEAIDTKAAFRKIFNYVGAFPLLPNSKDAAAVVRLDPGAYTVVATAAPGDPGGEVLIEVYFLP